MSRRRVRMVETPMAVTSSGEIVVNVVQLGLKITLDAAIGYATATGLPVFIGVVVPTNSKGRFVSEIDDMAGEVVGRLGATLIARRAIGATSAGSGRGRQ